MNADSSGAHPASSTEGLIAGLGLRLRIMAIRIFWLLLWSLAGAVLWSADRLPDKTGSASLDIYSVSVNGKALPLQPGQILRLPSPSENVVFSFGPAAHADRSPTRIRYFLDGHDSGWRENLDRMRLVVRFFDEMGDQVNEIIFPVMGQSPGWKGNLDPSGFTHRQETIIVPPRSRRVWVVMSSAGPPATVGIYVITHLTVFKPAEGAAPLQVLLPPTFGPQEERDPIHHAPRGWMPDGNRPRMAKVIKFGANQDREALALVDDDVTSHAEWHTIKESAPLVSPGDRLVLEWSELYSTALGGSNTVTYPQLPPGYYRFRLNELTVMGAPTEAEASLALEVPLPYWMTPWFWVSVLILMAASMGSVWRYLAWRAMQRELQRLEQQRAMEQERLRIAQDIHDDLGARVTQISLLSAMAMRKASLSEEAKSNFDTIYHMTRDLVTALYETVWAVNPENDNLDALGNYLCQMANQLCSQAQLRCRLEVPDLPASIPLASQARHNLIMVTKEAIHNIIKHARASEVYIRIRFEASVLSVSIRDEGCGFCAATSPGGNGLKIMKRRLADLGGNLEIDSAIGRGTTVLLCLPILATS